MGDCKVSFFCSVNEWYLFTLNLKVYIFLLLRTLIAQTFRSFVAEIINRLRCHFSSFVLLAQKKIKITNVMFAIYLDKLAIIFIFIANVAYVKLSYLCTANMKQTLKLKYYGKEECYYAIQDLGYIVVQ